MDILYLLIPMSVLLVLGIVGLFGWAINNGQLDDLEREGERIFEGEAAGVDGDQASRALAGRQFSASEEDRSEKHVNG
ncbi:cbb3-type cytochrome oxidase assembly protein CcoS [Paucibacter sp. O1-1]|uniref:cbb3-type cytochrome oxidase assembly protein CcoS n=1 Tax=Roseateles TaxID=93681 RepID=UPI0010F4F0F9|nr:cbb3-type cytochrome oxidase assembly protein CcoS [Paucibacter sp. M5-1]MCU7370131.1 cbb3-type cytochrome oxidase assembly protein CcoS [Paucibacter sp. O1-1]MCZ7883844.1 cbb3-type cytochrome oxidase assembly protein CcoS [Paucibacter sp. M5-1]MDA3825116.1 cbb3-type cytochrome oxidase assembly protein CcoS [Paucibacter sp. O1-1]